MWNPFLGIFTANAPCGGWAFQLQKNPRTKQNKLKWKKLYQNSCLTTNTTSLNAEYWHAQRMFPMVRMDSGKAANFCGTWEGGWGIALQLLTQETPSFVRTFWSFSLSSCQCRAVLSPRTVGAAQEGSSASLDWWDLLCPTQLVNWTDRTDLCCREQIAVISVLLWQIAVDKT